MRLCEPVPHDLVQVDQAPHDAMPQSTGHAWVLQARVSAECGHAIDLVSASLEEVGLYEMRSCVRRSCHNARWWTLRL